MTDVFPRRDLPGAADDWGRKVEDRTIGNEQGLSQLQKSVQAQNRNTASSLSVLSNQINNLQLVVNALPFQTTSNSRATGFGITGSYATYASDTITVPDGKTQVSVLCIGSGAVLDTVTAGLTTSYSRIVIAGSAGGETPAAKDAGATFVNNVLNASHARSFSVTPGSTFAVAFQMYGLNGSAFPAQPANFAQIATIATFTT